MVSKEGKKVQEEAKGVEGIGLSSGEERGRESVVAEASCPGDWRVARIWGREAPAHSSAAMCHQPCGHSATGEPVRSRLLPAPWQAGPPATTWGAAARLHPPQLQLLRPMAPPVPEPAAATTIGPDRHFRLVAKPAPPRLYSSSVGLAAAGSNKGIPFLSAAVARLRGGRGAPAASTHCSRGGGWWSCLLQAAGDDDATRGSTLLQRRSSFLFVSPHASYSSSSSGHKGSNWEPLHQQSLGGRRDCNWSNEPARACLETLTHFAPPQPTLRSLHSISPIPHFHNFQQQLGKGGNCKARAKLATFGRLTPSA